MAKKRNLSHLLQDLVDVHIVGLLALASAGVLLAGTTHGRWGRFGLGGLLLSSSGSSTSGSLSHGGIGW